MKSLFITATGTDVGKTVTSLAIAMWALHQKIKVAYYKPVQCGSYAIDQSLVGGDGEWINYYSQGQIPIYNTYRFKNPVSPHLAAEKEQRSLKSDDLIQDYLKLKQEYELVIIEGAGGVMVPLNREGLTLSDVFKKEALETLLVSSPHLGTLNHTLLSHLYLRQNSHSTLGFLFSQNQPKAPSIYQDNIQTIKALTQLPFVGTIPWLKELENSKPLKEKSSKIIYHGIAEAMNNWWKGGGLV